MFILNILSGLLLVMFLIRTMKEFTIEYTQTPTNSKDLAAQKRDLKFSNTVYLCQNEHCERRFFRLYQLMETYKRGTLGIPGNQNLNELDYSQYVGLGLFEDLGLMRCPACHDKNVERSIVFDWMKDAPAFPELTVDELTKRRVEFENPVQKKQLDETLDSVQAQIRKIDGIASYQYQYGLTTDDEADFQSSIQGIRDQLRLISQSTHHADIQIRARDLAASLNKTNSDRFVVKRTQPEQPVQQTAEQKQKADWNLELSGTIYTIIERMQYAYERRSDIDGELHIPQNAVGVVSNLRKRYIEMTAEPKSNGTNKEVSM